MIELQQITFEYAPGQAVFDRFDWQTGDTRTWAVLGPSGCGKSTLLYLLAGLRLPDAGQVVVNGQVLRHPRPQTGLIIQDYGLLPWATVRQNAELGLRVRNFYGPDGKHAPAEYRPTKDASIWLERLGLLPVQDKYPGQISGGQRQRTAIARTLAIQPDLLLMDEPFSSLDAPSRAALQQLTLELCREQGLELVLVTHAIEEAALLGRKILLLGQPPNRQALVIDNPGHGAAGYRDTEEYRRLCQELRLRMEAR